MSLKFEKMHRQMKTNYSYNPIEKFKLISIFPINNFLKRNNLNKKNGR